MTHQGWILVVGALAVAAGTTVVVEAQKGKPTGPSRIAATAAFDCPPEVTACSAPGIIGDGSGYTQPGWQEGDPGAVMLTSTGEMNITIGGGYWITLDFQGQTPQDSRPSDCSLLDTPTGCLWNWAEYPQQRTFRSDFTIQSNTLDAAGETELSNGLLGIPVGRSSQARLNMTMTVPETAPGFWRFDFNPNIPPNGGAVPVQVVRTDTCTWTFSAVNGEKAALSILVKPPKGKQYAHREGLFSIPFVLTYQLLNCPA
jgi:hypothetical protein